MNLIWRLRRRVLARGRPAGFTLIELLVVVAMIGVLLALLLPAVQSAREAARRSDCLSRLRQTALAAATYEATHGAFPIGCLECRFGPPPRRTISWAVSLLPYLDQSAAYEAFDWSAEAKSAANRAAAGAVVPTFLCPSVSREQYTTGDVAGNGVWDPGDDLGLTDYGGIFGVEGPGRDAVGDSPHYLADDSLGVMLYEVATRAADISDGLAHTALLGECAGRGSNEQGEWVNGHNCFAQHQDIGVNSSRGNELHSDHPGRAGLAFCDGHAMHLADSVDQAVFLALLTRAGGEVSQSP